ncbi:GGDEF domain-containing protein [Clostridium sp. DL1XJH146]
MDNRFLKNRKSRVNFVKYFSVIFIAILAISLMILYLRKDIELKAKKLDLEKKELYNVDGRESLIYYDLSEVFSDLEYVKSFISKYTEGAYSYDYIADNLMLYSDSIMKYDQIRYIDKEGMEQVRINYDGSNSEMVDKEDLQNKNDRYYFYETALLQEGEIFVSKFDLNIENGTIEEPQKPMIRFSTPIYSNDEFMGIAILNYSAQNLIEEFNNYGDETNRNNSLLNGDSYWLISEEADLQWGFMYDDKTDVCFKEKFQNEWDMIIKEDKGQFYTENGLFTFEKVDKLLDVDNKRFKSNIILYDDAWIILSYIDANNEEFLWLNKSIHRLIIEDLLDKYYLLILIFIVALFLTSLYSMNKEYKEEIKYFAKYDTMTNTFNRRAGLEILDDKVKKSTMDNKNLSICFIDINGLKIVNDTFGHEAGDDLIITVVSVIKKSIREDDVLIRLGGDEFLIVFPKLKAKDVEEIWDRITLELTRINEKDIKKFKISISHGISEYLPSEMDPIDYIINLADEKMYKEKKTIKENMEDFNRYIIKDI